ncbi:MAG TPA: O-antigen ligase family protein [Bacteroidota bacterium]|nr:O-antigen ligase family protein [Bacteroidota bacterium]
MNHWVAKPFNAYARISMCVCLLFGLALSVVILRLQQLPIKFTIAFLVAAVLVVILILSYRRLPKCVLFLLILSLAVHFEYFIAGPRETYHTGVAAGLTIGPVHVFLLLLAVHWLLNARSLAPRPIRSSRQITAPLFLLLVTVVLSTLTSTDKILSFYGLLTYVTGFLLYYCIARNLHSSNDLKLVLVSLQICVAVIGLVCILQVATGHNFKLTGGVLPEDPYSITFRAAGLSGSPNYTAAYLATLLPILLTQVFDFPRGRLGLSPLVALLLGFVGLFLTASRGALVSGAFGTVAVLYLLLRHRYLKGRHLTAALLVLACLLFLNRDRILSRIHEGAENLENRGNLNRTAAHIIRAYPFFGIGINTYTTKMDTFTPADVAYEWTYMVHNKYLLVWSEMGTSAIVFFLWSLVATGIVCLQLIRSPDPLISRAGIGLFGSLLVYVIHMNFEPYSGGPVVNSLWLYMGIAASLADISLPRPAIRTDYAPPPQRG